MQMRFIIPVLGLTAALFALPAAAGECCGGCEGQPAKAESPASSKDIVATAASAGSFKTLLAAAQAAGLAETLQGPGPFTVFAPSDEAFAKLPEGTVESLLQNKPELARILKYHVVSGKVLASQAMNLDWAETVEGQSLRLTRRDGSLYIDDARVVATDVLASNGVIHVIDRVVLPRKDIVDTAIGAGSFKTLVTAVKAAGLVETLKGKGPFTVFAPTDAAFGALPEGTVDGLLVNKDALAGILTYHVIRGRVLSKDLKVGRIEVSSVEGRKLVIEKKRDGSVTVNGANVASADVLAGNGVIHVIDRVITPSNS
jgi:uncharacterized surface protein with fasciclin (FAS1) repeats